MHSLTLSLSSPRNHQVAKTLTSLENFSALPEATQRQLYLQQIAALAPIPEPVPPTKPTSVLLANTPHLGMGAPTLTPTNRDQTTPGPLHSTPPPAPLPAMGSEPQQIQPHFLQNRLPGIVPPELSSAGVGGLMGSSQAEVSGSGGVIVAPGVSGPAAVSLQMQQNISQSASVPSNHEQKQPNVSSSPIDPIQDLMQQLVSSCLLSVTRSQIFLSWHLGRSLTFPNLFKTRLPVTLWV